MIFIPRSVGIRTSPPTVRTVHGAGKLSYLVQGHGGAVADDRPRRRREMMSGHEVSACGGQPTAFRCVLSSKASPTEMNLFMLMEAFAWVFYKTNGAPYTTWLLYSHPYSKLRSNTIVQRE